MEENMADDLNARNSPDSKFINPNQDHELRYWSEKLGVSREELKAAVERVGNSAERVQQELRRGTSR
jgi:energy-coupling factor transporter ATP-binding protein EcfA2